MTTEQALLILVEVRVWLMGALAPPHELKPRYDEALKVLEIKLPTLPDGYIKVGEQRSFTSLAPLRDDHPHPWKLTNHDHPWPELIERIPPGNYSLGRDDEAEMIKIDHGKPDTKWEGFMFITLLDASGRDELEPIKDFKRKISIAKQIAEDPLRYLKWYGKRIGHCGICGRELTNPDSIALGIGPICASGVL